MACWIVCAIHVILSHASLCLCAYVYMCLPEQSNLNMLQNVFYPQDNNATEWDIRVQFTA